MQISWQAQPFVNLEVQISRQAQHFVKLQVQISWHAQRFVNLHVQISWQAQYKMRFREIADARDAAFAIEPVASNLASLALRNDGCETSWVIVGSWSGHARIVPPL